MEWYVTLSALFGALAVAFAIGLPIAFSFLLVNICGLYLVFGGGHGLSLLTGEIYSSIGSFSLVPIPLFILMGHLLVRSGMAYAVVDAVDQWIGKLPGRLALTAVGAGTMFGALSGSSMASTAFLGSTLLPEMEKRRYGPTMSIGPILGAGGLAVLIPPSGLAVLLGSLANLSIAQLLIASLVPGLILGSLYGLYFVAYSLIFPSAAPVYDAPRQHLAVRLATLARIVPLIGIAGVVTGFIFLGLATPSESAALGVVASALVAVAFGKMNRGIVVDSVRSTVATSAMILLIVVGSSIYSKVLAVSGATSGLVDAVSAIEAHPLLVLIAMQLLVLLLGCFIDAISIMLLVVPIFMPIVQSMGVNEIWFAVLLLIQLELSGITPPFGVLLIVMKGVRPDLGLGTIYRAVIPMVFLELACAGIVMLVPETTSWLPSLMLDR